MLIRISHSLDRQSPGYPGTPPVTFAPFKSIADGDSSNNSIISLSSHMGTHIDAPRHFCPGGAGVNALLGEENFFTPVHCLKVPKNARESIGIRDIAPLIGTIPEDTQGILIRTGFYKYRYTDPITYTTKTPWIEPELPGFLRNQCPDLRLFGIDTISISNPEFGKEGHATHRSFLCEDTPILILEDANLSCDSLCEGTWKLKVFPWFIDEIDGTPVSAFMESDSVLHSL